MGRTPGASQVLIDGGLHGQTIRLEGGIGSHGVRFSGIIVGAVAAEWIGFRIERSFAIVFAGIDARRAARGVAADADGLAGLPRPAIDLATLKRFALVNARTR
jgi:hypothetical protein